MSIPFENICNMYNQHKKLQMVLPKINSIPNNFYISGINSYDDLIDKHYAYVDSNLNTTSCVGTIDINAIILKENVNIQIKDKIFQKEVIIQKTLKDTIIQINTFIKLVCKNDKKFDNYKITFSSNIEQNTKLSEIVDDIKTTIYFLTNEEIGINDIAIKISNLFNNNHKNEFIRIFKNNKLYFEYYINLLIELKIDPKNIFAFRILNNEQKIINMHK